MSTSVLRSDSETLRSKHLAYFDSILPEMINRLYWSRQQIDDCQQESFRSLLRYVRSHSPWYAERVGHIDPDRATLDDLKSIPPMTKTDLMENWDRIVTVPGATLKDAEAGLLAMTDQQYFWGDNTVLASGGTGGRPGVFIYDWNAMAVNFASMSRSLLPALLGGRGPNPKRRAMVKRALDENWLGFSRRLTIRALMKRRERLPARIMAIGAEKSAHGSYVMTRIFSNPSNPTLMLSSWRTVDEIAAQINDFKPEILSVYPTMMPALAEAIRDGRLHLQPMLVQFVSEHCSVANFRTAQELWPNATLATFWATSEAGATFPCPLGNGTFHVSEDLAVIEPIYPEGRAAHATEPSEGIYLTNFFNRALPIIRYHIDDMFEFDPQPCACGSAYKAVRDVRGRGWEKFHYGTIAVHPLAIELALLKQPSILTYQIRQTERGVDVFYVAEKAVDVEWLRDQIAGALKGYGVADPVVQFEQLPAIERTGAGKMRRFVPLPAAS